MEEVILVNEDDQAIGTMEKMEAHRKGTLHRAFSVFVFNSNNQLLLQKRARHKYHSGGLWSNTCCSHPRENETLTDAGERRLREELGYSVPLNWCFSFIYRAELDQGLIEHELDHVLIGNSDEIPNPNEDEVSDWTFMDLGQLESDMMIHPENYTEWFKIVLPRVRDELNEYLKK